MTTLPETEIAPCDPFFRDHAPIYLNDRWRVTTDDPLQYILQCRKGKDATKPKAWRDRSFCRKRAALLRCIREYCGEVDAGALARVMRLPEWRDGTRQPQVGLRGVEVPKSEIAPGGASESAAA